MPNRCFEMKKNVLKQLFPIFIVLTLFACNNGKGGMIHMPSAPSVEDCERDFGNMVNGSYATIESALSRVKDFISTYAKTDFPQLEDAYGIKMYLEDLKQFLDGPFDSVSDFIYLSNQKELTLENCNYPMVKAVWNKALENKKNELFEEAIAKLTKDSFEPYLASAVREIVNDDYDNEQLFGWEIERIDLVSLSEPEEVSGIYGKECTAVYRVHLRGNTLGIDTGTLKIQLIGLLSLSTTGELNYRTKDYSYLEKSSKL